MFDLLVQFEEGGALAGDDPRIVVGGDEVGSLRLDHLRRRVFPCLLGRFALDDPCAVAFDGSALDARCVRRHHDRRIDSSGSCGQGQCLGVVAARVRDHPAHGFSIAESHDGVQRTTKLECSHLLKILTLEQK